MEAVENLMVTIEYRVGDYDKETYTYGDVVKFHNEALN